MTISKENNNIEEKQKWSEQKYLQNIREGQCPLLPFNEIEHLVHEDKTVLNFLDEIRSLDCFCFSVPPTWSFLITLVIIFLPSLWSISSVLIPKEIPTEIFFDGCRHAGNLTTIAYQACLLCNGFSPTVSTVGQRPKTLEQIGFALVVVQMNVFVVLAASSFYLQLSVKEFTAIKLLSYDVMVKAPISLRSVLMLIIIFIATILGAILTVAFLVYISLDTSDIKLGNPNTGLCINTTVTDNISGNVLAYFSEKNPSTSNLGGVSLNSGVSLISAFISAFLLYIPLLTRLGNAVKTLFASFNVSDLMKNGPLTGRIFTELKYVVDYNDFALAAWKFSWTQKREEYSLFCIATRLLALQHCWWIQAPDFFGFTWPSENDENDEMIVNMLLTMLKKDNKLLPYEVMTKTKTGGGGGGTTSTTTAASAASSREKQDSTSLLVSNPSAAAMAYESV